MSINFKKINAIGNVFIKKVSQANVSNAVLIKNTAIQHSLGTSTKIKNLKTDLFVHSTVTTKPQSAQSTQNVIVQAVSDTPNYSDIKEFSIYFENKIRKLLKVVDAKDIQEMIMRLRQKTGADEKTVREVLSKLTQFSSYAKLNSLRDELHKNGIGGIYNFSFPYSNINKAFLYLQEKKEQINLGNSNMKTACILDNSLMDMIERNRGYNIDLIQRLNQKSLTLFHISGWNSVIDGKNVSQGFLGSQMGLEESAELVINKMKKEGISLDEALNGDFEKRIKEFFGNYINVVKIETNNITGNSATDIADNLKPLYPSAKTIKAVIDTIVDSQMKGYSASEIQKGREVLAKYFDSMISCDSAQTINDILRNKYKEIEEIVKRKGKTMDDVLYVIPEEYKSFDLITHQYANINQVDPNNIIYYDGCNSIARNFSGKVLVILDDVVGSGHSMIDTEFDYRELVRKIKISKKDVSVIFSPISSLQNGVETITKTIAELGRTNIDLLKSSKVVDYNKFAKTLSPEEQNLLEKLLGDKGYGDGCACTAMPYMLPDNNSNASGLLLEYFINNLMGSKCFDWFIKFSQIVDLKTKQNI